MTLEMLEQYRALKREYAKLCEELSKQKTETVSDVVTGSMPMYPYTIRPYRIEGIVRGRRLSYARTKILMARRAKLQKIILEIETWLDSIDDSVLRQIIRARYIKGKSWIATAMEVYGCPCEDAARKKVTRYLAQCKTCP